MKRQLWLLIIAIALLAMDAVIICLVSQRTDRSSELPGQTASPDHSRSVSTINGGSAQADGGGEETWTAHDPNESFARLSLLGGPELRIPSSCRRTLVGVSTWTTPRESNVNLPRRISLGITVHHRSWTMVVKHTTEAGGQRDELVEFIRGIMSPYMRSRQMEKKAEDDPFKEHRQRILATIHKAGFSDSEARTALLEAYEDLMEASFEYRLRELMGVSQEDVKEAEKASRLARLGMLLGYRSTRGWDRNKLNNMILPGGKTMVVVNAGTGRTREYEFFVMDDDGLLQVQGTFTPRAKDEGKPPLHLIAWLLGY